MAKNQKKRADRLDVDGWLMSYIYKQVDGEDYIDNLRWAAVDDEKDMKAYNEAYEHGCCGSFDGQVVAPDGKTYKVGCNYGH
jgi:hypothetical protein